MSGSGTEAVHRQTSRRKRRRWWCIAAAAALLTAGELVARFQYGLGDPPLLMRDPTIEYLARPSMTYHRFGNLVHYNQYSMRCEEFPARKSSLDELRVLLIGDSIINGGGWTDQSDLATTRLQHMLADHLHRPVVVANISAASWGPPNQLAYLDKFGWFDADIAILVVGSEDYGDVPHFGPLGPDAPEHRPVLALQEVFLRYVPQLVDYELKQIGLKAPAAPEPPPSPADIDASIFAMSRIIDQARERGIRIALAFHQERTEILANSPKLGYNALHAAAAKRDVPMIELRDAFAAAILNNHEPFRDWVHPNAYGQSLIADACFDWINKALSPQRP